VTYNTWHHVVLRYDGSRLDGFVDGVYGLGSRPGARTMPSALYYAIGATDTQNLGSGAYFNGLVDEVAIYPFALSNARVLAHYQTGKSAPLGGSPYASAILNDRPSGYWRLGETSGTTATDSSGYANNGSYGGGFTLGMGGALVNDPNNAARFDGTSADVLIPASASLNPAGPMTIEAWMFKTNQTTGPIVEYNNGTVAGVHFWNFSTSDQLYVNFVDTAGTSHGLTSPSGHFTSMTAPMDLYSSMALKWRELAWAALCPKRRIASISPNASVAARITSQD
jgi:hypothetical protein